MDVADGRSQYSAGAAASQQSASQVQAPFSLAQVAALQDRQTPGAINQLQKHRAWGRAGRAARLGSSPLFACQATHDAAALVFRGGAAAACQCQRAPIAIVTNARLARAGGRVEAVLLAEQRLAASTAIAVRAALPALHRAAAARRSWVRDGARQSASAACRTIHFDPQACVELTCIAHCCSKNQGCSTLRKIRIPLCCPEYTAGQARQRSESPCEPQR